MQTVLYEFMTQRDGTVHRLHQMLLKINRENDLSSNLRVLPRGYIGLLSRDYNKNDKILEFHSLVYHSCSTWGYCLLPELPPKSG